MRFLWISGEDSGIIGNTMWITQETIRRFLRIMTLKERMQNGMLFYEVGRGQASAVKKIMKECGFKEIKVVKYYNKIDRVVYGKL